MRKCIVLVSGGIDSTVTLYYAKYRGFSVNALHFRYGQSHSVETEAAKRVCYKAGVENLRIIDIDPKDFGESSLLEPNYKNTKIPMTYVPARNTLFLAYALAWAENLGALNIFIGANEVDYSGYPDCCGKYMKAFEEMANLGTRMGADGDRVRIRTPIIDHKKFQVIQLGIELKVDFSLTHSCYFPIGKRACGVCGSCQIRLGAFEICGIKDPVKYHTQ